MNGELEGTSKEAVEAYFGLESLQLPGQTQVTTKTSVHIRTGVPNEIRLCHIPNTRQKR